jgi:hypothetical protein
MSNFLALWSVDKQNGSEVKSVQTRSKVKTGEESTLAGGSSISSQLLFGESVHRSRQEAKQRSQERADVQEELRLLLLGIILRAIRYNFLTLVNYFFDIFEL